MIYILWRNTVRRYFLLLLIATTFMTCRLLTAETLKEHIAALLKDAPNPGKNGLTKKVPGKVLDARLGFFGLFAILKFDDQTRLGIFNIAQGKFQKMIKLKSKNFQYSTGSTWLVIYYTETNIIEFWDLQTMKKIKEKKISIPNGFLTTLEMPPALKSKVFVSGVTKTKDLKYRFYGILNLKTIQFTKFEDFTIFMNRKPEDVVYFRCNKNMTKILSWTASYSPSGFTCIFLDDNPPTFQCKLESFGSLNFANNDDRVLTTSGAILNLNGVPLKKYSKSMLFPVFGDDFYIQYKLNARAGDANLIVRDLNSHKEVAELTTDLKLKNTSWKKTCFTVDRRLLASKISARILIVDNKNLKLRIYPLGISGKSNSFGSIPKAFVGEKWICKLKYPKGTKVVIEDGPENMTFNTDSNLLIWDKPTKQDIQDVLLSVTKPGEEEIYKDIKIIVRKK